jgi:hypothetical protein
MTGHPAFRIVIAYETVAAAVAANELAERLTAEVESECDSWPFELLAYHRIREQGLRSVAAADMIILAAHGAAELPGPVKSWVESGLCERGGDRVALVALLDEDWIRTGKRSSLYEYLQQITKGANVALFCNVSPRWPRHAMELGCQPAMRGSAVAGEGRSRVFSLVTATGCRTDGARSG